MTRLTARLREGTKRSRAALLLQAVASNPRAPRRAIAPSLGCEDVGGIVFGALLASRHRSRRLYFAEAECIVRTSPVVFSDEVAK